MNHLRNGMTLAAAAAIALAAVGSAAAATMSAKEQALYAAAKKEGTITWYVSQTTTELADSACRLFDKKYPGVTCHAVRASGQVVMQRLMQEVQAHAVHADVMSSNDDTQMVVLKKAGALAEFTPEGQSAQPPALLKAGNGGWWTITSASPLGLAYNTDLVKKADAPTNWTDMYNPKWKGQVALGSPNFSGSVGVWTVAMKNKYGWDFFKKVAANKPQIGRSVVDGLRLIESGERKISLVPLDLVYGDAAKKHKPVAAVIPTDGVLFPPSPSAILKDAPHPNAARLFMDFMLSKDYSEFLVAGVRLPIRADVAPPEGMPAIKDLKTVPVTTEMVLKDLAKVREQFRDTMGI